jgi:hypothetical protein
MQMDELPQPLAQCFEMLAIFLEDDDVPLDILSRLWAAGTAGGYSPLDEDEVKGIVEKLRMESLVEWRGESIRLIDAVRDFLCCRAGEATMAGWHAELLRRCGTTEIGTHSSTVSYWSWFEGRLRFARHACRANFGDQDVDYGELAQVKDLNLGSSGADELSELTDLPLLPALQGLESLTMHLWLKLCSAKLPAGLTCISESGRWQFEAIGTFDCCTSLHDIELPAGLTSIGRLAFRNCSSLSSIKLPPSLTSIGDHAFEGCSSLSSIKLPPSLTSIGNSAFQGCSSLSAIELPAGLTSIDDWAFSSCSSLSKESKAAISALNLRAILPE